MEQKHMLWFKRLLHCLLKVIPKKAPGHKSSNWRALAKTVAALPLALQILKISGAAACTSGKKAALAARAFSSAAMPTSAHTTLHPSRFASLSFCSLPSSYRLQCVSSSHYYVENRVINFFQGWLIHEREFS